MENKEYNFYFPITQLNQVQFSMSKKYIGKCYLHSLNAKPQVKWDWHILNLLILQQPLCLLLIFSLYYESVLKRSIHEPTHITNLSFLGSLLKSFQKWQNIPAIYNVNKQLLIQNSRYILISQHILSIGFDTLYTDHTLNLNCSSKRINCCADLLQN